MNKFKAISAAISLLLGYLFNDIDGLMWALITLMILDYISGVIVAVIKKNLSSEIGAKGIAKKLMIFIIVIIANIVDVNVICQDHILRNVTIMFYIANESISIIENAAAAGVPVPQKIISVLGQIKKKGENDNSNDS